MPEQTIVSKPSLYGGISKQPVHLRHPSQVEDAINSDFSPAHGAFTRSGTKLVANLGTCRLSLSVQGGSGSWAIGSTITRTGGSGSAWSGTIVGVSDSSPPHLTIRVTSGTPVDGSTVSSGTRTGTVGTVWANWALGTKLRLHPIFRDKDEIYLLVQGPSSYPRIVPVGSVLSKEAELREDGGGTAALTYLTANNPTAADYRYLTALDYTYIVNSTVAVQGSNFPGSVAANAGLAFATMPHTIKRVSTSPLTFAFNFETWEYRGNRGTNTTNPLLPPFGGFPNLSSNTNTGTGTGNKISDLCIFQDRLVLAMGPWLVCSQTRSFTDFWYDFKPPPDDPVVVDSDPVIVRTPGPSVTFLDRLAPLRRSVIVSAVGARQFELTTTGDVFSPSSVSFTPSTSLNATNGVALAPFQTGILFFVKNRNTGSVHYYVYDDAQIAYTSMPLSSHVEGLIPPNATRVVADTNSGFIGVITSDAYRNFYVMRWGYEGGRLVQTAWSIWNFSGPNDILLDAAIINGVLYILVESEGSFLIEGMPLGSPMTTGNTLIMTGSSVSSAGESAGAGA